MVFGCFNTIVDKSPSVCIPFMFFLARYLCLRQDFDLGVVPILNGL